MTKIRVHKLDWRQVVNLLAFDGEEINIVYNFEVDDGYTPMIEIENEIYKSFHFDKVKKFRLTTFAHNEGKTYYVMRADRPIDMDLLKEAHEKFIAG